MANDSLQQAMRLCDIPEPQEVARCTRALTRHRGNRLIGVVAINSGLGLSYEDAVSKACECDEDLACLTSELLIGLADASGLRDAIFRAVEDYFEEIEVPAC